MEYARLVNSISKVIHCDFLFTKLFICERLLDQNGLLGMSGRLGIDGVGFPGGGGAGLPSTGRFGIEGTDDASGRFGIGGVKPTDEAMLYAAYAFCAF